MRIKKGVSIAGLSIKMRPVLLACDAVFRDMGVEFVITSGLEGVHSAGSLHYYGRSIDARSRNLKGRGTKKHAAMRIQNILGKDYDVVLEKTHIHIEYDPKEDLV